MEQLWDDFLKKPNKTYPEEMLTQAILTFAMDEDKIYNKLLKRVEFIKTIKAKKNNNENAIKALTDNDHENYIAAKKIIACLIHISRSVLPNEIYLQLINVVDGNLQASLALGDLVRRHPSYFSKG